MSQSRNLSRSMKEIEDIYESVLNEKFDHQAIHHNKEDDKLRIAKSHPGPESVDNFKTSKVDTEDLSDKEEKDNAYEPTKFSQNSGKVKKESINNSVMSEDNIFDKLYRTVMEGDELEDLGPEDFDDFGGEDDLEDASGSEESVSVQLSPTHVEALLDLLAQVEEQVSDLGDEEDDIEDIDDGEFDEEDEDSLVAEAPTPLTAAPDGVSKLTSKNNKVGKLRSKGGKAQTGNVKEDGDPKELPDSIAKMTNTGAGGNKVGATGEWGG